MRRMKNSQSSTTFCRSSKKLDSHLFAPKLFEDAPSHRLKDGTKQRLAEDQASFVSETEKVIRMKHDGVAAIIAVLQRQK